MSDTTTLPPRTHNLPAIIAPTDTEMLADLNGRYPELVKELAAFEDALSEYPTEFTLADEDRAAALQDLLGQMKKHQDKLAAHKKSEKKPWNALVSVVQNFFTKPDDRITALDAVWRPRWQAFMDLKKAENLRKAEEEAAKQRAVEEANRKSAQEAAERAAAARAEEAAAREREAAARAAEEQAERDRVAAMERKAAAEAEEKRIADEKKARDRAEKETNDSNLRAIRRHMKDVERLNTLAEADEAEDAEIQQLDAFIRPGGIVSVLAGPVASSMLLDDAQKAEIEAIRLRLAELRQTGDARYNKREQAKRAKAAKEAQEAEERAAAARKAKHEEDERVAAAAKVARELAETEAQAAKEAAAKAKGEIREARADQRGAVADQRGAAKDQRVADTDADRAANRAGRIENKIENSNDADMAGTLRGDLGSKGSLTKRWALQIEDEAALRASCGPLGEHFTFDALNGAAYRWMNAHRTGFTGERVEGALPGVVFMHEQGGMLSTS